VPSLEAQQAALDLRDARVFVLTVIHKRRQPSNAETA